MKANKKQRRIIKWAVFVFLLATLFPPWLNTYDQNGQFGGHRTRPAGFSCILSPPEPGRAYNGVRIDTSQLLVEWVCILVTAGAACFFLNTETVPASPAPSAAQAPSAGGNRLPISIFALRELIRKRWVVSGVITVLSGCVIGLILLAIDQAETIEQTRAKEAKDAQVQQQREQQWQAFAAQEKDRRQKAESIVKVMTEEQSKKADAIAQEKAERIEQVRAKWKSLSLGMSPQQVEAILGQPDEVNTFTSKFLTYWYRYEFPGFAHGDVSFKDQLVDGWSPPSF